MITGELAAPALDDHRVTNGHEGSRFFDAVATVLQRVEESET